MLKLILANTTSIWSSRISAFKSSSVEEKIHLKIAAYNNVLLRESGGGGVSNSASPKHYYGVIFIELENRDEMLIIL